MNKIINGDCLWYLKGLPDGQFDLVITSPPYNLGNTHHTGSIRHSPYSDNLPEREYQSNQVEVLNELFRVVKDSGSLIYNHKNRIKNGIQITPYEWILKTKWLVKQELVWFNRSQNFDKVRFFPMTERIYWLAKSPKTVLTNTINHHDLFRFESVGTGESHTRAFPLDLARTFLTVFPEAREVLDPYMGSGTVGFACKEMGRNFTGIELKKEYCELANERLNHVIPQMF